MDCYFTITHVEVHTSEMSIMSFTSGSSTHTLIICKHNTFNINLCHIIPPTILWPFVQFGNVSPYTKLQGAQIANNEVWAPPCHLFRPAKHTKSKTEVSGHLGSVWCQERSSQTEHTSSQVSITPMGLTRRNTIGTVLSCMITSTSSGS